MSAADSETRSAARRNLLFNAVLMVVKLLVGILGRSEALIADGLHSGADVLASVAVIIGLAVAGRPPDSGHHYGHAKAEAISQKVVAVFLLLAGLEVANNAMAGFSRPAPPPSWVALGVAVGAMIPKAVMAVSQRRLASRTGSHGILAAAVDNQMDAFSSLVAAVGILLSRIGYAWGDSAAALVVALLVMWAGVEVFRTAALDLMDPAADPETEQHLKDVARSVPGVLTVSAMRTRQNGAAIFVDLEIDVARDLTLLAAHDIAHRVEEAVHQAGRISGVTVHVNPARRDEN